MKRLETIGVALGGALVLASVAVAQLPTRHAPVASAGNMVRLAIGLQLDSESFQFTGQGNCTHAPKASIYNAVAQQWNVSESEGSRSMALTFWKPMSGSADMFSLRVSSGGKSHVTNTVSLVRGTAGTATQGSGNTTLALSGNGGTFTINATAANGTKIRGTITCDGFTMATAEGGD